jgi:AcrR family transcriptional regulator
MARKALPKTRAKRNSLTEARLVAAALAVLERHGVEGLTMRGVARELGTGPMSLYRHVRDRAALIELVRRHVMAPPQAPSSSDAGSWQEMLRALLHDARARLRRHRGAVGLFDSDNFEQPAASIAVERALECLELAGLGPARAARVAASLWMYTVGSVLAEQSSAAAWPSEELSPARRARWAEQMQSATPRIAAAVTRWTALDHDEVFEQGLDLFLAGIASEARRRRRAQAR